MIRCPACQAANEDRAIFCTSCGALVNQEIAKNVASSPATAPPPASTFQGYGQQPPTSAATNPSAYAGSFGQQNASQPAAPASPPVNQGGYTLPSPSQSAVGQPSSSPVGSSQQPVFTPPASSSGAYTPPVSSYVPAQQSSHTPSVTPQPASYPQAGQGSFTPQPPYGQTQQSFAPAEQMLASFAASIPGSVTAGRLQVYPTRLVYTDTVQAFVGNRNQTVMAYRDISDLSLTNTMGLIPNGLVVRTKTGAVHTFACWERERIIALVRQYL